MAELERPGFRIEAEWLDGSGVTAPELRATWARYEVWLSDRCVTQVDEGGGSFRRSVYVSLYPLAEWIAENWWALTTEVRPSAIPVSAWRWSSITDEPWLARHNVRAAADGMAWPDLTIVPEGQFTRFVWRTDHHSPNGRVAFSSDGHVVISATDAASGLRSLVERVLTRLEEQGVRDTPLEVEWQAVRSADEDEADFCRAAARLGLDPYAMDEQYIERLLSLEGEVPAELLSDFLDTVDPGKLLQAVSWLRRAQHAAARKAAAKTTEAVSTLQLVVADVGIPSDGRPWQRGYEMARRIRAQTETDEREALNSGRWVAKAALSDSHGLQGAVIRTQDAFCGVTLPADLPVTSVRFAQARSLGKVLTQQQAEQFVLSKARTDGEKLARAFAAELLAPAGGIRSYLEVLGSSDDAAMEAIASRYGVSPLLIRHQYDNQILERADVVF